MDKNTCITLPRRNSKYLEVDNFLSEYDTEEERELAMRNLLLLDKVPTKGSTRLVNSGDLADFLENFNNNNDAINLLTLQVHNIIGSIATTGININTTIEFVGTVTDIIITATCSEKAIISISDGNNLFKSNTEVKSFTYTFKNVSLSKTFVANYNVYGVSKTTKNVSVNFVYPIYYGSSENYTNLINTENTASKRSSLNGTYNINVNGSPKYIWFIIPSTMEAINTSKQGGFEFSLDKILNKEINDIVYYIYRTPQKQQIDNYSIVLT